jgi:crossover junction endodeoxyribonuclease RuvC
MSTARHIIGIDPGMAGALSLVAGSGELVAIEDMPVLADGANGRRTVNAPLLADLIRRWGPDHAFIELITARPTDAKVAAFAFGRCRGALEGVLGALGIPVTMITVPSWRRLVGLPAGATKDMARSEAIRRWPSMASCFARKRDDGRAEAGLIGAAGLLKTGGRS